MTVDGAASEEDHLGWTAEMAATEALDRAAGGF